jgi:hypothetical protein
MQPKVRSSKPLAAGATAVLIIRVWHLGQRGLWIGNSSGYGLRMTRLPDQAVEKLHVIQKLKDTRRRGADSIKKSDVHGHVRGTATAVIGCATARQLRSCRSLVTVPAPPRGWDRFT